MVARELGAMENKGEYGKETFFEALDAGHGL